MDHTEVKDPDNPSETLQEGRDYYLENGFWVFTEYFLLQRGHCCGSGCRHCPYRKKKNRSVPAK